MNRFFSSVFIVVFGFTSTLPAQTLSTGKIESMTRSAIERAYKASVRCYGYDTIKKQQVSSQFSGVCIKDGYVLTAAHAIVPKQTYKVRFPDGREALALGLGEIANPASQGTPDMAIMHIQETGSWPSAELGWSYSLLKNEPCISIAYPTTLNLLQPTIRFGQISNPLDHWGFITSTCKMEPGDSGGGLFDYMGRLIGLHSRIALSEDINFEVPIDNYRTAWSSLLNPESQKELPSQRDDLGKDPMEGKLINYPYAGNLPENFNQIKEKTEKYVVSIRSILKGKERFVLGTLVSYGGKTMVLSKNSEVGNSPRIFQKEQEASTITVLKRDPENDLIFLGIGRSFGAPLKLDELKVKVAISQTDPGRFLLSTLPDNKAKLGVISSLVISLPRKFSIGHFGANASFIGDKITLTRIDPSSPAAKALQLNDIITGINAVPISLPPHYAAELIKYAPGDTISIQGIRGVERFDTKVILANLPMRSSHPSEFFAGGRSVRSDGFPNVFVHDMAILPEECGSPVFDQSGQFKGINIARFSRTSTLAIPSNNLKDLVQTLKY